MDEKMSKAKKQNKPMPDKEYVKSGGSCPFCKSNKVTSECDLNSCDLVEHVTCDDCNEIWRDIYKMVGYELLEREVFTGNTE